MERITLASADALAFMFGVKPATIRQWACRGHITRAGTAPGRGRPALYDADEAEQTARRLGHIDNTPASPSQ